MELFNPRMAVLIICRHVGIMAIIERQSHNVKDNTYLVDVKSRVNRWLAVSCVASIDGLIVLRCNCFFFAFDLWMSVSRWLNSKSVTPAFSSDLVWDGWIQSSGQLQTTMTQCKRPLNVDCSQCWSARRLWSDRFDLKSFNLVEGPRIHSQTLA